LSRRLLRGGYCGERQNADCLKTPWALFDFELNRLALGELAVSASGDERSTLIRRDDRCEMNEESFGVPIEIYESVASGSVKPFHYAVVAFVAGACFHCWYSFLYGGCEIKYKR
jgi:hypothetical protein